MIFTFVTPKIVEIGPIFDDDLIFSNGLKSLARDT